MAIDLLIFLAILIPTTIVVYKVLKVITKVVYVGIAMFVAYLLIKFLIL